MTYNDIAAIISEKAKNIDNYNEMCDIIEELKSIMNDYDPIKLDVYNQLQLLINNMDKKEIGMLLSILKKVKKDIDNKDEMENYY